MQRSTTQSAVLCLLALVALGSSATNAVAQEFEYAVEVAAGRDGAQRIDADYVFRSGDRFRVAFKSDFDSFVYLFSRGTGEGSYARLFPHGGVQASNLVRPNFQVRVPDSGGWLTLDDRAGVERLVLVISNRRQRDLEETGDSVEMDRLDYTLSQLHRTRSPAGRVQAREKDGWRRLRFRNFGGGPLVHVTRIALTHHGR